METLTENRPEMDVKAARKALNEMTKKKFGYGSSSLRIIPAPAYKPDTKHPSRRDLIRAGAITRNGTQKKPA